MQGLEIQDIHADPYMLRDVEGYGDLNALICPMGNVTFIPQLVGLRMASIVSRLLVLCISGQALKTHCLYVMISDCLHSFLSRVVECGIDG